MPLSPELESYLTNQGESLENINSNKQWRIFHLNLEGGPQPFVFMYFLTKIYYFFGLLMLGNVIIKKS